MLSKKFRLNRKEIENLKRKKGILVQGDLFGLAYERSFEVKFSIIISNKVCPKATERNRIKRLFYKAVEKNLSDLKGHFLFLAKRKAIEASSEDFGKEIVKFKELLSLSH